MMDIFEWSKFDNGRSNTPQKTSKKRKFYKMESSLHDRENGIKDDDGVLYSKDKKRILRAPSELEYYTIPEGVEIICTDAFHGCKQLKKIALPETLECIGRNAFAYCESLELFHIPSSVEYIGGNPIWESPNTHMSSDSPFFIVDNDTLYDGHRTRIISFLGDTETYKVPIGIKSIGNAAFNRNKSLRILTIGNDVSVIQQDAFFYCENLEDVFISDKITEIGQFAFCGCHKLKYVHLSNSLTILNPALFSECISLETISIPDSITHIYCDCFHRCYELKNIKLPKALEYIGDKAFQSCNKLTELHFPNSLEEIDDKAFRYCANLTEIWFMGNCPIIGDRAFKGCRIQTVHVRKESNSDWKKHFPYANIVYDL